MPGATFSVASKKLGLSEHVICVSPEQLPLKISRTGSNVSNGSTTTESPAEVATNVYHKSLANVEVDPPQGCDARSSDAPVVLPEILLHELDGIKFVGKVQSSFTGAGTKSDLRQALKLPSIPFQP